jgi:bifunctional UDP-N-acetylglucosamine pyrophosphorylase/glucosamine-1-phosphate N-acetyltransferase
MSSRSARHSCQLTCPTTSAAVPYYMTESKLAVVVLAAGLGTRMKSDRPKVLHEVAGRSMLGHVLAAVAHLAPERVVIVAGPGMEGAVDTIATASGLNCATVIQRERLGTGHALACAKPALDGYVGGQGAGDVLVVFGDTPLLTADTLQNMLAVRRGADGPDLLGLAFRPADPARYGRLVCDADGQVLRIVEYADASEAERRIDLCNAGVLLGDGPVLFGLVDRLGNHNAKGEYYLTDVYALANAEGRKVRSTLADPAEVLGVDSRPALAHAEAILQDRLRTQAMDGGATLIDPQTVYFSWDTRIGRDVVIEPNVVFGLGVVVEDEAIIHAFCHFTNAHIGRGAEVGPFARLRPGADIRDKAKVGNFVEMKNAVLGPGAKANHLSYLGDTEVGEAANIGAGTITCNYDGIAKHRTTIGAGAFIGSNTALIAPVNVGPGAIVGAGTTIGGEVGPDEMVVVRGDTRRRPGAASRFRERRRAEKAKQKGS